MYRDESVEDLREKLCLLKQARIFETCNESSTILSIYVPFTKAR